MSLFNRLYYQIFGRMPVGIINARQWLYSQLEQRTLNGILHMIHRTNVIFYETEDLHYSPVYFVLLRVVMPYLGLTFGDVDVNSELTCYILCHMCREYKHVASQWVALRLVPLDETANPQDFETVKDLKMGLNQGQLRRMTETESIVQCAILSEPKRAVKSLKQLALQKYIKDQYSTEGYLKLWGSFKLAFAPFGCHFPVPSCDRLSSTLFLEGIAPETLAKCRDFQDRFQRQYPYDRVKDVQDLHYIRLELIPEAFALYEELLEATLVTISTRLQAYRIYLEASDLILRKTL